MNVTVILAFVFQIWTYFMVKVDFLPRLALRIGVGTAG